MLFSVESQIIFFLLAASACHGAISQKRFSRLQWPSDNAELKIIPNMKIPMTMAPSVQSGMNVKMPITLQFPSFFDVMRPVRTAALAAAALGDPVVTMTSKLRGETSDVSTNFVNSTKANARAMFYKTVESSHQTLGKVCLLRAICEVAEVPAVNSGSGIIGELIDMLLTTSSFFDSKGVLTDYAIAERYGKSGSYGDDNCRVKYKKCPFSLFNIIHLATSLG